MEMRSYTLNSGGYWEWDGCAWEVTDAADTSGDFSAYGEGEPIRLVAFDAGYNPVQEHVGTVQGGAFHG